MPPLQYHRGQIEVQEEANTRVLADNLSRWVGPVAEFAQLADLFLLATQSDGEALQFTILSGPPPLVDIAPDGAVDLRIPDGDVSPPDGPCGGLAINLAQARRARINGVLRQRANGPALVPFETFTLCRKYMAPSLTVASAIKAGPTSRSEVPIEDAGAREGVLALLARAETIFLASVAPDGGPDVAHRGGPPGFVHVDFESRTIEWPEYLGDGVFKSAGNVRATGRLTLLVPDFETGSALEIVCRDASYTNIRTSRRQRLDPLVQERDPHPLQGTITARVDRVIALTDAVHARQRIPHALRLNSTSSVDEQAPQ